MAKASIRPTYFLLVAFIVPLVAFLIYDRFYFVEEIKSEGLSVSAIETEPVVTKPIDFTATDAWPEIYPLTKPMTIKGITVNASIAKTWPDRIRGLSGTPYIPMEVVKVFVFGSPGRHSIWMKDMNYPIDILWVSDLGKIVSIKKNASPESYPESFSPDSDAYYVIETKAGFVDEYQVVKGDEVVFPDFD